jgi:L-lactate dehydrogenase complex protein LldG
LERVVSGAREDILGRIRRSRPAPTPEAAVDNRLADRAPWIIPARGRGTRGELLERFIAMATEASATVAQVAGWSEVPAAVQGYLVHANLPAAVVCPPDPLLERLPWNRAPNLAVRYGRALPDDVVSVTGVVAAVAETGTLLIRSGPTSANTLHFLPEAHIALVPGSVIVGAYEDAWAQLRAQTGERLPRVATMITGPSRSSDIERTLAIGVHGPRRLHIVIVDDR